MDSDYTPTIYESEHSDTGDDAVPDENDDFYFESDHLALRGNLDYIAVLRTIAILQTQRIQATKDIDRLATSEKFALTNPEAFLAELKADNLQLPSSINIVDIPKINFEKYGVEIPEFIEEEQKLNDYNDVTVRGRIFDQSKPETFNQLWTCEEQRRLEELLIEYPPEPVEMRRFAKIARALGNRTTKQVASRLQKFFKKLHSAGMPVPGRIPKSNRAYISKSSRIIKQALRPTTFFPANHVPVTITDEDDYNGVTLDPNWYRNGCSTNSIDSNDNDGFDGPRTVVVDEDSGAEESATDETLILKLLMRVRRDKEKDSKIDRISSEHEGFKCDYCSEEPIRGTRWHCSTCTQESIDLCSDCLVAQIHSNKPHPLKHKIVGLRISMLPSATQSDTDSDGLGEDYNIDYEDNKIHLNDHLL